MQKSTETKTSWIKVLAWVFGVLWLLGWIGGGVALMIGGHIWPAVFCYVMSPIFLIIDIVAATRSD